MHRRGLTLALAGAALVMLSVLLPMGLTVGVPAAGAATANFEGHGSIEQAYVLGAPVGHRLALVAPNGHVVGTGVVNRLGTTIVRNAAPGDGYRFRDTSDGATTTAFKVLGTNDPPPERFYADQHLEVGLNYLTMRDGVKLAAVLHLPPGKTLADGPFPTVIEYSGYQIAGPDNLISAVLSGKTSDPLLPSTSTIVGSVLTPLLGFATLSVQMRGTGCSGGAYDLFGLPSDYDGYDMVQIAAAQPWALHHKVGMVGISYSGISQMMTAGTRPPGLAAITPLSTTDDLYSTGYPGGIYNDGFAKSWVEQQVQAAEAAPQGGLPVAKALIADGDAQCLADQDLHLATQNIKQLMTASTSRTPALFDQRSQLLAARRIDVPVFMVGNLEDEQTGPQWPVLIDALTHDPNVWVTMQNGTHVDSLGPATITRMVEFLHLFVAGDLPSIPSDAGTIANTLYAAISGGAEPLPALRFTDAPNLATAIHEWKAQDPRVRVLFDSGNSSAGPGALGPTWEEDYSSWPPPTAKATTFDFAQGGFMQTGLSPGASGADLATHGVVGTVSFRPDPSRRPATDLPASANAGAALPPYDWTPVTGSSGVGFVTTPLTKDVAVIGPGSLNLELESSAADTDLQATVSEVYPDGQEMYVTSGFLRAGYRALDASASSALAPVHSFVKLEPLPQGKFAEVRMAIDPIAHVFRAGSRIRVVISAPGGDRPAWAFNTPATHGRVVDTLSLGGAHPSALVLPVVAGVTPGDATPPCPSLRGEPCRSYVAAGNGG